MRHELTILAITLASCCCTKEGGKEKSAMHGDFTDPPGGPVIVRIVGRDTTITARAGATGHGPVYSVESTANRAQILPPMDIGQLQAAQPELAHQIRSMHASNDRTVWAGVE
jgi:hypothetical protein